MVVNRRARTNRRRPSPRWSIFPCPSRCRGQGRRPGATVGGLLALVGLVLCLLVGLPARAQTAQGGVAAGATDAGTRPAWWSAGPILVTELGNHASAVRRVGIHRPSGTLISVSDDKSARIWDLASGQLKRVFRPSIGPSRRGALHGVAPHPHEDLVALGGNTGDLSGWNRILMVRPSDATLVAEFDARGAFVRKLAWSGDASVLLAVYEGENAVRAFGRDGQLLYEARLRTPSTALSVAGDRVVAAAADGQIIVLTARAGKVTETGRLQRPDRSLASVALSPDGQRLAIGYRLEDSAVEILALRDGSVERSLALPRLAAGSIQNVAWSLDGRSIYAAGRGYESAPDQVAIFRYDAASGSLAARVRAARDSILELEPMADGRLAFGAFDGSWGIIDRDAVVLESRGELIDLRGADKLRISESGRAASWADDGDGRPSRFDFDTRLFGRGAPELTLLAPRSKRGLLDGNRWLNERAPVINGQALAMSPGELSLSLSYLRQASDEVIVGTQRRLIRLDARGATRWQVNTASEVRAVNVSADDRLVVTAMSDGTLRWWQASDGKALLTLLATRDGRWVSWTPGGDFDASPGADRIVGWAVNRRETSGADFVSLNRFADTRNRPEAIDQAIGVPQRRRIAAGRSDDDPRASASTASPVVEGTRPPSAFPPVARWIASPHADDARGRLQIPIAYRTSSGSAPLIQARFDGRPAPLVSVLPYTARVDGGERAVAVEVPLPTDRTLIQILLSDRNGTSESLTLTYRPPPPALSSSPPPPVASSSPPPPAPMATPAGPPASTALAPPAAATSSAATLPPTATRPSQRIDIGLIVPAVARPPSTTGPSEIVLPDTTVDSIAPRVKAAKLYVLAVGVSHYQRRDYDLALAAKDAGDFAQAMRDQAGRLYPEVQTRVLTNERATRDEVQAGLEWIADSASPGDVAMVFIAGHGLNDPDGRYYFLPHDGDHRRLADTAVDEDRLRSALSRIKGKVLMFVDTCFGGAIISSAGSVELRRMANSLAAPENGVIVFASSSGRQESLEKDEWGNGAFTKALIAGLRGKADLFHNGRITYKSLDFYVSDAVTRLTEGRQTPVTISPIGIADFLVAVP